MQVFLLMAGNVTAAPRWLMCLLQRSVCFHGRIFSPVPGTDKVAALDLIYCNVNRTDTLQSDLVRSAANLLTTHEQNTAELWSVAHVLQPTTVPGHTCGLHVVRTVAGSDHEMSSNNSRSQCASTPDGVKPEPS
jgi:hypothetical protein